MGVWVFTAVQVVVAEGGCAKAAILKYITNNLNISDNKNRVKLSLRLAKRRSLERWELKSGGKKNEKKTPSAPAKLCKTKGPGKGRRWKGKQKEEADKTGKEGPSEKLKVRVSILDVKRFSFIDV
nr:unnamed protein product [Haemonchus contortus]